MHRFVFTAELAGTVGLTLFACARLLADVVGRDPTTRALRELERRRDWMEPQDRAALKRVRTRAAQRRAVLTAVAAVGTFTALLLAASAAGSG